MFEGHLASRNLSFAAIIAIMAHLGLLIAVLS